MNTSTNSHIQIRRIHPSDEQELGVFFELVLRHTYQKEDLMSFENEMIQEIEVKKQYVQDDFNTSGVKRFLLVAVDQSRIVGTLSIGAASDNDIIVEKAPKYRQLYELGTAFVHPDEQNKGIVSKLIDAMSVELRARGETSFCLDSGYPTAQKIWNKKFGAPSHHLKDFWGAGSDHMIWEVKL